jgi:hypothetical protein
MNTASNAAIARRIFPYGNNGFAKTFIPEVPELNLQRAQLLVL